jgi:hypothetical protein
VPVLDALQIALESHRYALALDQDNIDTVFNTSQVLTSIAEEIAKDDSRSDAEALHLLEEALELQSRCLGLQELKLAENTELEQEGKQQNLINDDTEEAGDSDNEGGGASLNTATSVQEDQWFSIVEPVTPDTLIDTIIAQLGTLTTLCSLLSSSPGIALPATLAWVEEYSRKLLSSKLQDHSKGSQDRKSEISVAKASFIASLLEAGFRSSRLDVDTYKRELEVVYAVPELVSLTSADAIISKARALIAFSSALADSTTIDPAQYASIRWTALVTAIAASTTLCKIPDLAPEDKAKSHSFRGEASLLQHQMSHPPTSYQTAIANEIQLLKNAEVFYRNASKLSLDEEEKAVAGLRSAVAGFLHSGDKTMIADVGQTRGDRWLRVQIEDMILESLIPQDFAVS